MREWLRRLGFLGRFRRFDDELDAEIQFHVDMRARALEDQGLSPDEARQQARREVGRPVAIRESARDAWTFRWFEWLGQDLRYAARGLRRQPAFAAAVIGTLALGIGANTAVFSVVDALLVRPAPFADPGRLLLVRAARPALKQPRLPLSYANFLDLRTRNHSFESLAAWTIGDITITGDGDPEQVQYSLTTSNLFDVLGVRAARGRTFRAPEDRPGTPAVAVISYGLWRRRFAQDDRAIGRTIVLDGTPHEIVGVMPRDFSFANYPHATDLWIPFGLDTFTDRIYARGVSTLMAVGRLRAVVTPAQAATDVTAVAASLERDFPDVNRQRQMFVVPFGVQATAEIRGAVLALAAGVVLVLLIACANVANLLLSRASARQHEFALRAVLGGSRRRIATQLLTEHLVFALAGGAAGLGVAWLAHRVLARLPYNSPDSYTPWVASLDTIGLDGRVLSFTLMVSVAVGLLVGLLPAIRRTSSDQAALVAAGTRVTGHRQTWRVRAALVVAEVAMAVVLLTGMALMLTTVTRLMRVDPGFNAEGVVAAELTAPASRYPAEPQIVAFYDRLIDRLTQTSGVAGAGAVEFLPFGGLDADTGVLFEGRPIPAGDQRPRVHYRSATPTYFGALGVRLIAGRSFAGADAVDAPKVAILNETAARQLFPDGVAIGRRVAIDFEAMRFYRDRAPDFDLALGLREVVGVVGDIRHTALADGPVAEMYVPLAQRPVRRLTVVVRSTLEAGSAMAAVRAAVAEVDRHQPIAKLLTVSDLIAASTARPRFNSTLITSFALVALALAAIGIYGVMSYFVALRTRDLGIHLALGATPRHVFGLVTRQMLMLTLAGLALGLAGAIAIGPALTRLLFGVEPRDPSVLAAVAAVVFASAAVATVVPALRALRIEPARALRAE